MALDRVLGVFRARAPPSVARETEPLLMPRPETGVTTSQTNGAVEAETDDSTIAIGRGRTAAIVLSMWVLIFLQASNMSGMTMTQSTVAADLGAYEHAMWFTSAYLIATASFAPLMGRLATVFPPGALVAGSAGCFAAGTVITARAQSLASFLTGRVVVGIGAAGVMTLSLILVLQLTARHRRGLFVGLVNAGFTIGLSTAAVVYGTVLPVIGWRALFLVQAPLALVAGAGVCWSLPPLPQQQQVPSLKHLSTAQKLARIDYLGALLLTLTIVLFLASLSGAIRPLLMALSAATLVLFVVTESWFVPRVAGGDPIVPLELLRSRGVLLSCLAQLGVMAARWTVLYYAPIFVLAVRGRSAAAAGSVLIPTNLGFGTGGLLIGWLHVRRAGAFWLPSCVALVLFAASLAAVGETSQAGSAAAAAAGAAFYPGLYLLSLFANGFCTGAYLNYTLAHLLHLTRPSTHFVATSLLATFRGFSGSFGTSIGGGVFTRQLTATLADGFAALDGGHPLSDARRALITRLVGSPALVYGTDPGTDQPVLTAAERAVAVAGYEASLTTLYRGAAVVALLVLVVQAGTGWTEPEPQASDDQEDQEEILEAIAEHDGTMEA